MKPFNLQEALAGKAVKLRNGEKAFVRHRETVLNAFSSHKLLGYLASGELISWSEGGYCTSAPEASVGDGDIIGMYPETKVINGFEVPVPETHEPSLGSRYYLAGTHLIGFRSEECWGDENIDRIWLERGLVFLSEEGAIATGKAMLGIDPNSGEEK